MTAPDVGSYYAGMSALLPEMILGLGVVVLLLTEAFVGGERGLGKRAVPLTIGVLAAALLAALIAGPDQATLFSGMVVVDGFSRFFRVLSLVAGMVGAVVAMPSSELGTKRIGEYFSIYLALVLGMILMASSSDLLMIYVSIELVSLMSFVLVAFRPHNRKSSEAGLKYVIYGGAASGVMLVGFSLIFGLTGHTQLSLINESIGELSRSAFVAGMSDPKAGMVPVALTAGLVLSFCGYAYKIAAVPLHMWSPDVYEGAPTPFTAFLSTGPKAAGFAALTRFFVVGFSNPAHFETSRLLDEVTRLPWPQLIVIVSLVTMTIGNLAAIGQSNVKRFLAYSSIAHAGYSLIGLAAFSRIGVSAVLMYMAFYVVMNMGAFYAIIWFRERIGSDLIDDYSGLGYRAPLVAIALAICLFSLTGLPPFAGFIGKFYLFSAALDRAEAIGVVAQCLPEAKASLGFVGKLACSFSGGSVFLWLAVVAAVNSAISLYYYARIVRRMFLDRPVDETPLEIDMTTRAVLVPVMAVLLIGGLWWTPLWNAASGAIDFRRPTLAEIQTPATPTVVRRQAQITESTAKAEATPAP